jgi:hypothetical protein
MSQHIGEARDELQDRLKRLNPFGAFSLSYIVYSNTVIARHVPNSVALPVSEFYWGERSGFDLKAGQMSYSVLSVPNDPRFLPPCEIVHFYTDPLSRHDH